MEVIKNTFKETLRYEYKMTADTLYLPEVFSIIARHPSLFFRPYPIRKVNNIYFETPGLTSYFSHTAGTANREKTRIRWYGSPVDIIERPVLERKIKYGQVGEKLSEVLPPLKLEKGGAWPIPQEAISSANDFEHTIHWRLRTLLPIVALRYERHYFSSADGNYRLTVDSDLEYFGLSSNGNPKMLPVQRAPIIIELKYDTKFVNEASEITKNLPFRITSFSKYIYAINGLNSNPDNLFID